MDDTAEESALDTKIAALRDEMAGYTASPEHFIADAALYGMAIDVLEHALAVQLLKGSEVPRTAFANARAAFESGQDILYLTSAVEQYDRFGCLALVHELREVKRLQVRFNRASEGLGLALGDVQRVDKLVEQDASEWDIAVPGCGDILRRAYQEFGLRNSSQRKHWTGLTREQIGVAIAAQLGDDPSHGGISDAFYGTLSAQSHARMRMNQRGFHENGEGMFEFTSKPVDRTAPGKMSRTRARQRSSRCVVGDHSSCEPASPWFSRVVKGGALAPKAD